METSSPEPSDGPGRAGEPPRPGDPWRLGFLFGSISFLLGVGDPTEGLIAQPVGSLLKSWGRGASQIATFSALLAVPWSLKPLYGLLSDFVPLWGSRRKSYLIVNSALSAAVLFWLGTSLVPAGSAGRLMGCLLVATLGVAFSDVVSDALMVEYGQPRGLTGRLQAVQWGSLYASGLLIGPVGGFLCERHRESWAFLICGFGAASTLGIAVFFIRETVALAPERSRRDTIGTLARSLRSRRLLGVAAFLFLWNFNPFSNAVLYVHLTRELGFSEQFYGGTVTLTALASIAASVAYGFYCRRVPMRVLAQLSVGLGVGSTLAYASVTDERSAVVVTMAVGFTYMTATLIQLDLAAQACPPEVAGTVFALLMAIDNLSASLGTWLGGLWYDRGAELWGARASFQVLLIIGAGATACCWLLVPFLPRGVFETREGWSASGEDDSGFE